MYTYDWSVEEEMKSQLTFVGKLKNSQHVPKIKSPTCPPCWWHSASSQRIAALALTPGSSFCSIKGFFHMLNCNRMVPRAKSSPSFEFVRFA